MNTITHSQVNFRARVHRDVLFEALEICGYVLDLKTSGFVHLVVMEGILFCCAVDQGSTQGVQIRLDASVEGQRQRVTISHSWLSSCLLPQDEMLEMVVGESRDDLVMTSARSGSKVMIPLDEDAQDLNIPSWQDISRIQIYGDVTELVGSMKDVATYPSDLRLGLKAVQMLSTGQVVTLLATDGNRLAVLNSNTEYPKLNEEVLLPLGILHLLVAGARTIMAIDDKRVYFDITSPGMTMQIWGNLFRAKFPDLSVAIPSEFQTKNASLLRVSYSSLYEAALLFWRVTTAKTPMVFSSENYILHLMSNASALHPSITINIPIEQGTQLALDQPNAASALRKRTTSQSSAARGAREPTPRSRVCINAKYVFDALRLLGTVAESPECVLLYWKDELDPLVVSDTRRENYSVIMPIRI